MITDILLKICIILVINTKQSHQNRISMSFEQCHRKFNKRWRVGVLCKIVTSMVTYCSY